MVRTAHPLLLGFRHREFLDDTINRYKLIYGLSGLKHKVCCDDEGFLEAFFNKEKKRWGICFTQDYLIWLNSGLDDEHDATLVHELLHGYMYLWGVEDIINPSQLDEIIEEETTYILEDEPEMVEHIKKQYNCDRRKYR